MLENKLRKAAQAIIKNNSLLITSGSGMAADCQLSGKSFEGDSLPVFRGTHGLWKHYPVLKQKLIGFDEFIEEDFFKDNLNAFWYVWGDVFMRQKLAKPHLGYAKLS